MTNQARVSKVLISLVVSMTIGALALMVVSKKSPSGGAFSLASYTTLDPVEQAALSVGWADSQSWNRIEVFYSHTSEGNIGRLAVLNGLTSSDDVNFHFVICNGKGGADGQIQSTERWSRQRPCLPSGNWYGTSETVRICVIADSLVNRPTDCQVKRTAALVELLARKFAISPRQITYPADWQL
jgi:hypothetical protein